MRLISIRALRVEAQKFPDLAAQVDAWSKVLKDAEWKNLEEVKQIYQSAEAVGNFTVFNLKGNKYRLIVGINYEAGVVYFKYLLTHAEYDKDKWKNDPYF